MPLKRRREFSFIYHDKLRKGEPQCYGINKKGNEALRVHLLEGGTRPEQMFVLDKIKSLVILNETFIKPGPNFKKGDKDMITIFCELDL